MASVFVVETPEGLFAFESEDSAYRFSMGATGESSYKQVNIFSSAKDGLISYTQKEIDRKAHEEMDKAIKIIMEYEDFLGGYPY